MQKYSGKKSPKAFSSIAVRSQSDSHKDLPITSTLSVDLLKNLKKKPVISIITTFLFYNF